MSGVGNDSLAGSSGHYLQREFHDLLSSDRGVLEFLSAGCLDGIWYWDLLQPEHEWMSRSFWETLGYDPLDKPHLSSAWQDIINPDDLQLALENAKRHFEDPAHPYDQIVRYRHTEGHTVWIRCRGLAVRDAQGQPRRMLGAHTDVTELKRAEEELRLRTQELDLILEHMPARIWLKDDANKIIRCNRAAAISMGFEDEEQLRGSDTYELFPAMAQKYHDDDLAVLDSGQARLNIEERYTPRDGASAWISTDKVPVETERGERRLLVMSTDVTERIAREQRLSQLNESLRDFTHIAAHDLQAPLRQVAVLTEMLAEELGQGGEQGSEDVQDVVRGISTGVRRMRSLVSSLHQLSKLESISIEREVCDLPSVVAEGRSLAAIALEESKAAVVVDALPRVQGSSELLAQLFQNLFSNACKYAGDSPPRIRIWSEVNHERGVDLVYFEDRGVGIPLKSQERVFESFHRLHHSDDIEGTGIGLSICRRIVQAHDGKLYIDPDYADGVRFVIALPLSVSGGA